jgi:hypothetical protein
LGFGAALIGSGAAVLAMAGTGTGADAGVAAGLIVGAATLLTLGEMLHSAAWWTIAFEAAPRDRRTEYVVLFDLGLPLAIGLGPVLFVGVLAAGSVGWLVYAGIVVGAAAAARMLMTAAPQAEPAAA